MAGHVRFHYGSLGDLSSEVAALGVDVRFDEDISVLKRPVNIGGWTLANALGILPMEGADGGLDGTPGELTYRRYDRFGAGGAGLVWFEATAVAPEGRANPRQLWINQSNADSFARLVERFRSSCREGCGAGHNPLALLQLTHSGRMSKPQGEPAPIIAVRNPMLDPRHSLGPDYPVITDDELAAMEDRFVAAARLAWQVGFQGVDLKATHGYLCAELLGARTRPGRYGGSFENRTRFLINLVRKVKNAVPGLLLAVRLGASDGMPYPYGWGVDPNEQGKENLEEPIRLARLLHEEGVRLLSVSAGNFLNKPYWMRPFDQPDLNVAAPDEHPLVGVARLFRAARAVQEAVPEMAVMGAGYSWLRQYFPFAAAANVKNGWCKIAGLGREAFAYPDFARDLLERGRLDPRRVCTTCSKCSNLMRSPGGMAGCVTRDSQAYLQIYREHCPSRSR